MTAAPLVCPIEFEDPGEFHAAWATILNLSSCFVPGPQLAPQTPVVVALSAVGIGRAEIRGLAMFNDVDSWGRPGIVVSLDPGDLVHAREIFEGRRGVDQAAQMLTSLTNAGFPEWPGAEQPKPAFATTMIKAGQRPGVAPAGTPIGAATPQPLPEAHPSPANPSSAQPPKAHEQTEAQIREGGADGERFEPGTLLEGRFQIEGHLATGGMGDVYRAVHVHLKRPVALKLLKRALSNDPEMWARFQREAELVSQLESPHIVRVFDFGKTTTGQPFLAMEFVEGTTLDNVLSRIRTLRPVRAVDLILQIAEGLEEAHAMGIVHRDLKPPNIMIGRKRDGSEVAKILDFGIARIADNQKANTLTQMGMVVGTPAYLAPEQALADTLDARTDIYALGCVAFEMLTGRPPFVYDQLAKLVSAHLHETPPALESIRPELKDYPLLCQAVLKALEKDRTKRFQDVGTLALVFARSVEGHKDEAGTEKEPAPGQVPAAIATAPAAARPLAHTPLPSAFEDWPPPEQAAAQAKGPAAEEVWPPPEPVKSPSARGEEDALPEGTVLPESATTSQVMRADEFFGGPQSAPVQAPAPSRLSSTADTGPKKRLERELAAAQVSLEPERVQKLVGRREAIAPGPVRGVGLFAEILGTPQGSPLRARCTTQLIMLGAIHGGVVDHCDEDGVAFFFPGDETYASGGRALVAALAMREAVVEERFGVSGTASLRAAVGLGRADVPQGDEPMSGELLPRVRKIASRGQAGQLLVDKAMVRDLGDLVELRDASTLGVDAYEVLDRKLVLPAAKQRLLGREPAMAQLDKRLSGLINGTVAPVLVLGASGTGKSAIAQELTMRARHQSFVVGMARGLKSLHGTPYAALAELLCNVCGVPKDRRIAGLRGALEKLNLPSAEIEAALVVAGVQQLPRPLTPGQAVHSLRTVMATGAVGRKVVLVFDGLESLDRFSVDAFTELCASPRPNELTVGFAEPAWARERLPSVPVIELGPLSKADVVSWLAHLMPEGQVSEKVAELLFTRGKGNPGIVLDWLHLLCDRGLLRLRSGMWVLSGEPPPLDDAELARERLQALGAHARRIFEAACIAGDAVDSQMLSALVPDAPQAAYQRVVSSRMLRAVGGRRWAVSSDRYLLAALEENSPSRLDMHQRFAAQLVERSRAANETPDAAKVATHLTNAGDGLRALPIWRRAAEQALARRAPRDTVEAFKGWADALALMPGGDGKSPEVVRARLDALSRAAGNALACDDAVLARALVDDALAAGKRANLMTAELQLMVSRVLRSEARRARSAEALGQAEQLAKGTPIEGLCQFERGEVKEAEGDPAAAAQSYKAALGWGETTAELARWYGEVDFHAAVEVKLAGLAVSADPASAKKLLSSALGRLRTAQAPYTEARAVAMLGQVNLANREWNDAIRNLEEAANAAARAGDSLFQTRNLILLSQVLAQTQHMEMAWKRAEAARRLAMSINWAEGRREAEALLVALKARPRA